jgi:hypothetical protein
MTEDTVSRLLDAQEAELVAKLAQARARLAQGGNRGDAAEIAFREFLSGHLSRRLDVGQGEVIDTMGRRSRQLDVVVTTEDHPFRQAVAEPGLFIVEGVFAAGEVKAALTTRELADAIEKGRSVKELEKWSTRGSEVFATPSDRVRWVEGPPPFMVFAYENDVAVQTLVDRLASAADPTPVDAVFILGYGAAINYGDGVGAMRLEHEHSDVAGWAWSYGRSTLLQLLGWLHSLPRVSHRQSPFLRYLGQAGGHGSVEVVLPTLSSPAG